MPDPMPDYEIGAYRDAYNELRVAAESRRVEMMDEDATVSHEEASVRAAMEAGATVVASLRAALAQRREGVTEAMVEAAARVLFRQLAEENYALIHPDDIKVTREALTAALAASGEGA